MAKRKLFQPQADWFFCPRCESRQMLHSKLTNTYWCRRCGAEFIADFLKQTTRLREKPAKNPTSLDDDSN